MCKTDKGLISVAKTEVFKEKEALISQGFAAKQGFPRLDNSGYQGFGRGG